MSKLKDFFRNRVVAIALTAAVCLGCVGYGMVGSNKVTSTPTVPEYSGIYYVMDEANVLSDKTESALSDYNFQWDQTYGSVVGAATVDSTDGQSIEDFTYAYGEDWGLGSNDMMILLDVGEGQWYFVSSKNQLVPESVLWDDLDDDFAEEFEEGDYDAALSKLYRDLDKSYGKYAPKVGTVSTVSTSRRGGISGFGLALLLALVIIVLSAVDRRRYRTWNRRYRGNVLAPAFVPILFWHGVNSSWRRKLDSGFADEPARAPHRVEPGAYTTYSGSRPGDRYKNYNYSSGRPGSFGGSGYGGGRSSGSRSSGSFGGSSRGGSFGGGGSGFSGSRGGGFGGKR